jgi:hypothetical protein
MIVKKRINNEIKKIENYLISNNLNISFLETDDKYILHISHYEKHFLDFIFPNDYPFKPYNMNYIKDNYKCTYNKFLSTIQINQNIYHKKFMSNYLDDNFKITENYCCFCCSSLTCGNKWNPRLTIHNGILEYKKIYIYILYSSPLMLTYLEKLYNNLFPQLSDDLKEKIFSFC